MNIKTRIDFDSLDYDALRLAVESDKIDYTKYGFNTRDEFLEHIEDAWMTGKKGLLNCYLVDYRFSYELV